MYSVIINALSWGSHHRLPGYNTHSFGIPHPLNYNFNNFLFSSLKRKSLAPLQWKSLNKKAINKEKQLEKFLEEICYGIIPGGDLRWNYSWMRFGTEVRKWKMRYWTGGNLRPKAAANFLFHPRNPNPANVILAPSGLILSKPEPNCVDVTSLMK